MAERPRYRQGRIVWALLRSHKGKKERHPAIIISADSDIIQPAQFDPRANIDKVNAVAVIGVSTKYLKYPPSVAIPYSPNKGGHAVTKLTEDCGACIGWYDWVVLEDDIEARGGDVPPPQMDQIMDLVARDLRVKLSSRAAKMSTALAGINELLSQLLGEP
jgi:hypothetical protein